MNAFTQKALLNKLRDAKKRQKKNGFTLIELLITVVILGVLSAVALPGFLSQRDKADVAAANSQGKALMAACKTAIVDQSQVTPSVNDKKTFGKITWTPAVTQVDTEGIYTTSACSSTTSGGPAGMTQQKYILNVTTGDATSAIDASI